MYDDDFDALMADTDIGDFSAFTLSKEEIEEGKKERKAQIERDVKELKELMAKAEETKEAGGKVSNDDIRRMKKLSQDKMVMIAAMDDQYTIDDLVDMENGDYKEKEKPEKEKEVDPEKELLEALRGAFKTDDPLTTLEKTIRRTIVEDCVPVEDEELEEEIKPAKSTKGKSGKKQIAYYVAEKSEDDENITEITVVSKKFWCKEHCLDDSWSEDSEELFTALTELGCSELMESIFETSLSIDDLIEEMDKKGFELRTNKAFEKFVNR